MAFEFEIKLIETSLEASPLALSPTSRLPNAQEAHIQLTITGLSDYYAAYTRACTTYDQYQAIDDSFFETLLTMIAKKYNPTFAKITVEECKKNLLHQDTLFETILAKEATTEDPNWSTLKVFHQAYIEFTDTIQAELYFLFKLGANRYCDLILEEIEKIGFVVSPEAHAIRNLKRFFDEYLKNMVDAVIDNRQETAVLFLHFIKEGEQLQVIMEDNGQGFPREPDFVANFDLYKQKALTLTQDQGAVYSSQKKKQEDPYPFSLKLGGQGKALQLIIKHLLNGDLDNKSQFYDVPPGSTDIRISNYSDSTTSPPRQGARIILLSPLTPLKEKENELTKHSEEEPTIKLAMPPIKKSNRILTPASQKLAPELNRLSASTPKASLIPSPGAENNNENLPPQDKTIYQTNSSYAFWARFNGFKNPIVTKPTKEIALTPKLK